MHRVEISPDVLARLREQRGRIHVLDDLELRKTAHIIIDLQNGFMEPGAPIEVPTARAIVDNVNSVSNALRSRGGRNVFVRMTINSESQASWSNWFRLMLGPEEGAANSRAFAENAHYWQLWPDLRVESTDIIINKTRFGAFVPNASGLHELLQGLGIDTLIITGTLTNVCCESTARDAMQMNYKVIFVSDATAALSDSIHNATLNNMALMFADVMTTSEVLGAIRKAR